MHRVRFLKIILFALVSLFLMALFFIVYTISEAPLERIVGLVDRDQQSVPRVSELEELSSVIQEDLRGYLLFSNSIEGVDEFINHRLQDGDFEGAGSSYLIKKTFQLPELFSNDCQRIYCFQNRMRFEDIPGLFWKGLIGVEDSRFLEHKGVDFKSILRAVIADLKSMSLVQGGSTITQQLVKNLYFSNEKKLIRKLKELIIAIYLEWKLDKEKILEAYFNEIYWGVKQGVYLKGIGSASLFYFGKKPRDLSEYEVAILISMLKGPNYYNPLKHLVRLQERTRYVFKRLLKLNFISDKAVSWNLKRWNEWVEKLRKWEENKDFQAFYHVSRFKTSMFSSYEKYILLKNIQKNLMRRKKSEKGVQLAVKASFYDLRDKKQSHFYSNIYRNLDKALKEERHQVGSILKPIIYSFFVEEGKSLEDMVETAPIDLKLKSGEWSPKEAHSVEEQEVTLRKALQLSFNRPLIRVANDIGFETIEKYLVDYIPGIKKPLGEYPAQLLGAVELSVQEVQEVYSKFIARECSKLSETVELEQTILYSMSDPSMTTIRRQIGEELSHLRFFGKTGTSNNGNDSWFVGFDGRLLGVFWFGNEGEKSRKNLGLYGSTTAFKVYQNFLHSRGKLVGDIGCHFSL